MNAKRRIAKEPGEERQLLQAIGNAVFANNAGSLGSAQGIPDFEVSLAAGDLACVSPKRSAVDDVRIVDPLGDLVGGNRRTVKGGQEQATHIEIKWGEGLEGDRNQPD